jgi:anti-sigma factor RsiW
VEARGEMPVDQIPPGAPPGRAEPGPDPHEDELADLTALVLGRLPEAEEDAVRDHLSGCVICLTELPELEATAALLGTLPPEAFEEGPPDDADLLVRRTVQAIRREAGSSPGSPDAVGVPGPPVVAGVPAPADVVDSPTLPFPLARPGASSGRWQPSPRWLAAAAAVVLIAAGAGALGGRLTATSAPTALPEPTVTVTTQPPSSPLAPGTKSGSHTDTATGVRLAVQVAPEGGWVRVAAVADGVPAGTHCRLVAVDRSGHRTVAGSWLSGGDEEHLQGSALVDPGALEAVQIENGEGRVLVTTTV